MNRSVASVMENAIGLLCQLLRAIVFEAKEDSALPAAMRTLKISWWRLTGRRKRWWWRSSPSPPPVPALWPMTSSETSNSHYLAFTVVFVVIMSGKGQAKLSKRFVHQLHTFLLYSEQSREENLKSVSNTNQMNQTTTQMKNGE